MRNVIVLSSFVFLAACSTGGRSPSSQDAKAISLDTHVHIEDGDGYRNALEFQSLAHSFLISQSFRIRSVQVQRHSVGTDFESRSLSDDKVAEIVAENSSRFSGLCGLNLSWEDGAYIVGRCLKHEGMVGVKIHDLSEPDLIVQETKWKVLDRVLELSKTRPLVVLWHVRSDPGVDTKTLASNVKSIFDRVLKYPQAYFILAHAMDSYDATSHLSVFTSLIQKEKERPKNLMMEISATTDLCANDPTVEKWNMWKEFGWDYVLMGSDSSRLSWPGEWLLSEELSVLKNSGRLTADDVKKVSIDNGLKLLKIIRPDIHSVLSRKIKWDISSVPAYTCDAFQKKYLKP